jgi:hypothetical protein
MLDDLLADTSSGHNIVATVFVEASSMERDTGPVEMRPVAWPLSPGHHTAVGGGCLYDLST